MIGSAGWTLKRVGKVAVRSSNSVRVSWAPADGDHLSYRDDNEAGRGNEYAGGDARSLTLTGLPEGVEYKVLARVRNHDGEHTDSPWSGPWGEARLTVASTPVSADASLGSLSIEGVTLSPAFDAAVATYNVVVGTDDTSATVSAASGHAGARVAVAPSDASAEGHQVTLAQGENTVIVQVTPEDGTATRTCTFAVVR